MKRENNKLEKKVLVALSGGVDSAVAAALLKKRGFKVLGVFFLFFENSLNSPPTKKGIKGGFKQNTALNNAKRTAKALDIPLKIVDARKEFKKKIINYFIAEYKKGNTPNPCVVCNKEMKFRLLFDLLKKHKADFISTGHYAQISRQSSAFPLRTKVRNSSKPSFIFKLHEARDKTKDQSYFIYRLTQKELAKIIFPLGMYKKTEVKKMAKKFGLPILSDEESQDICFLLGRNINLFLERFLKPNPGKIVDDAGKSLGKHKGLPYYTIGQRKGIEIGGKGPYFVFGKNSRKNELAVSNNPKKLLVKKFFVKNINWVNKADLADKGKTHGFRVQIRYHAEKIPVIIRKKRAGIWEVRIKKFLRAVTPGQSAVFSKKDEVLGGGIII